MLMKGEHFVLKEIESTSMAYNKIEIAVFMIIDVNFKQRFTSTTLIEMEQRYETCCFIEFRWRSCFLVVKMCANFIGYSKICKFAL